MGGQWPWEEDTWDKHDLSPQQRISMVGQTELSEEDTTRPEELGDLGHANGPSTADQG